MTKTVVMFVVATLFAAGLGTVDASHAQSDAVEDALEYLRSLQRSDGSIAVAGSGVQSSAWAAIAFASAGVDPADVSLDGGASLRDFVVSSTDDTMTALSLERQMLAIASAGSDPRTAPGFDAVAELGSRFDGTQIEDPCLLNDDIFGLQALHAAGVPDDDPTVAGLRSFVLANQQPSGAFSFGTTDLECSSVAFAVAFADVDMTSQGIVALISTGSLPSDLPILRAEEFMRTNQNIDGGCGAGPFDLLFSAQNSNGDSTSWAITGIIALGQDSADLSWTTLAGNTPASFLVSLQRPDGHFQWQHGVESFLGPEVTTAYAVVALSGHTFVG